jgi:AraC-like DNA-binding protein
MSKFRGDSRVDRSARGIEAVRRVTRVSNDILVHLIEVDVLPGRGWADLSSDTHATLSIVLDAIGGRVENRLKRDAPALDGPFNMCFAPAGAQIWGCSDGVRRVRELRLDFDLSRLSEALGQKLITSPAPRLLRSDRLRRLAECLAGECDKPDRFSQLYVDALTMAVSIDFLRLDPKDTARLVGRLAPWQLQRVTDYVTEHLSDTVRLKDLAGLAGLSQSHFGRAFKTSTGLSPHRWQLNARIAKAQQLLLSHSLSLAQIAVATGFADQSHFCRVFNRMVGTSPAAWERMHFMPRKNK